MRKTIKGKVLLDERQAAVFRDWCRQLQPIWNRLVTEADQYSIHATRPKHWKDHCKKLKVDVPFDEESTVLPWVWAKNRFPGAEDGKVKEEFYPACQIWDCRRRDFSRHCKHVPRSEGSPQNPLVEFYELRTDRYGFRCPLPVPKSELEGLTFNSFYAWWKGHKDEYSLTVPAKYIHSKGALLAKLAASYKGFFTNLKRNPARAGRPKRKNRYDPLSFVATGQTVEVTENGIKLDGHKQLGFIEDQHGNLRRRILGTSRKPKMATLFEEYDGFYLAISVEELDQPQREPNMEKSVGLDWGVVHSHTLSNGKHFMSRDDESRKRDQKRLQRLLFLMRKVKRLQQTMAKQSRGSKNWLSTKKEIQRCNAQIARIRNAGLEYHTSRLARHYDVIAVEDLNILGMVRASKPKLDKDGHWAKNNRAAKAGLNHSILNNSPGKYGQRLEQKLGAVGGIFLEANPKDTSITCSTCGHKDKANRPTQDTFTCTACGHSENADVNASRNILMRALEGLAVETEDQTTEMESCTADPERNAKRKR